jgi:hypothetical protein
MDDGMPMLHRFETKVVNYLWHFSSASSSPNHGDISLND